MSDRKTCLYRHFNAKKKLLYVGISCSLMRRVAMHRAQSEWFLDVKTISVETFDSRAEAIDAERMAIATENPRYNIQSKPRVPYKKPRKEPAEDEFPAEAMPGDTIGQLLPEDDYCLRQVAWFCAGMSVREVQKHMINTGRLKHFTSETGETRVSGIQFLTFLELCRRPYKQQLALVRAEQNAAA